MEKVLCSLTALFLVLNCQSIWQNMVVKNYHIYEICFFLILVYSFYVRKQNGILGKVDDKVLLIGIGYYILIAIVILVSVSNENMVRFLSRFIMFPVCLLQFSSSISERKKYALFNSFINWVAVISWISLLLWVASTIGVIYETSAVYVDWFGWYSSYFGLYFSSVYQMIDWVGYGIRRNIGIFTEGPMFMMVLVLSILFMLIIKDYYKPKKWKIYGIVLALLSVASVTGYIFLMLIGGIMLMHKYKNKRSQIFIGMIAIVGITLGVTGLIAMKSGTASYIARFDDYFAGIKCWIRSPLIGNGYENTEILKQYMSSSREWNQGFSNTIFSVLAYGGILFLIPFIVPILRGIYCAVVGHDYALFIFCIVYLGLYFTVIAYTFFINYYIWAFLMCIKTRSDSENLSLYTPR